MSINYFENNCRTSSNFTKFGLCDDPPPDNNPAYIDETDEAKWLSEVINSHEYQVNFRAIDNCIAVLKADGNLESRCDGFLEFNNKLIFVELKNRESGKWVKKGREQLTISINRFRVETIDDPKTIIEAYICNSLKPIAHYGQASNIQQFMDDTGLILHCKKQITL